MLQKVIYFIFFIVFPFMLMANYTLDTNNDGKIDIWVEELAEDGYIISTDTSYDGNIDSKLVMDKMKLTTYKESDFNLDGVMDNFYYYENGYIIRQEVDSNYDQMIDVWVYITNDGTAIYRYEKDIDYDGKVDKIKDFEVDKDGK